MKARLAVLLGALPLLLGCRAGERVGPIVRPEPLWAVAREAILDGLAAAPAGYQDYPGAAANRGPGGVFVRLCTAHEELGCQGFLNGVEDFPLAARLAARNAAFFDSRYPAVSAAELRRAELEITTIGRLERVRRPLRFRLGKDALYLRYHSLAAFLQPSVAREHRYSKQEFLDALSRKAGLKAGMWQNSAVELYRASTLECRRAFFAAEGQ